MITMIYGKRLLYIAITFVVTSLIITQIRGVQNQEKAQPKKLKYAGVHDAARPYITEAAIKFLLCPAH